MARANPKQHNWLESYDRLELSPSWGGATSISVTSRGFLASQATAALHLITLPWVDSNWARRDSGSLEAADDMARRIKEVALEVNQR